MNHLTDDQLLHLLDGTIAPTEHQRLNAHLAACKECRQKLAWQRAMTRSIKHQPLVAPSPRFTAAVMRRALVYERQSAFVHFLVRHGTMLALIIGLSIVVYAFSTIPALEIMQEAIHKLPPEEKMTQYVALANRAFAQYLQSAGEKIIDLAGAENIRLFILAMLVMAALALFDRLVRQQLKRIRS